MFRLVPDSRFNDCPKLRTRTIRGTLFPLFDEKSDLGKFYFILQIFLFNFNQFTFYFLVISRASQRIQDSYILITGIIFFHNMRFH